MDSLAAKLNTLSKPVITHRYNPGEQLFSSMIILLFTVHNVSDVFQYLTDLEVNTTVNDSLISEVCLIVINSHFDSMHKFFLIVPFECASLEMQDFKITFETECLIHTQVTDIISVFLRVKYLHLGFFLFAIYANHLFR